jgi:hypothetical protein
LEATGLLLDISMEFEFINSSVAAKDKAAIKRITELTRAAIDNIEYFVFISFSFTEEGATLRLAPFLCQFPNG